MSVTDAPLAPEVESLAATVRWKIRRRILPLLLLMYVVAYLDRANLGFAKLQMKGALGFTDAVFGWGIGLFFAGYLLLEIPGALLVEHWSARKWFARILVTWGLCSMATALVKGPTEFYLVRLLLGLAEAGFYPGVIVYFTHWFPQKERALAMAGMLLAVPGSLGLGAGLSAVLLDLGWFGLAGWQWVFLIEGAPAVLLGIAIPFLLPDRPRNARWLTPAEQEYLVRTLEAEKRAGSRGGPASFWDIFKLRAVWHLAAVIFVTNLGGFGLIFWLPTLVKGLLTQTGQATDDTTVLLWTMPVFLCGTAAVVLSGWSSDRTGDRKWHCFAGQVGAGSFIALSAIPGQPWAMVFVWLCAAGFWAYFWIAPYWVLPTLVMTSSVAAVAIGTINICANVAGLVGQAAFGEMRDAGLTDGWSLLVIAGCYTGGGVVVARLRLPTSAQRDRAAEIEGRPT
jgi:ACS family tartrate transporter-like MFS transporter